MCVYVNVIAKFFSTNSKIFLYFYFVHILMRVKKFEFLELLIEFYISIKFFYNLFELIIL